ncbi:MAG: hypothetical protein KatS3mg059_1321 [Thermomicrobiales bacterium]|nr:MAG: hypothetical protein KatS3mg059_1321 [Thermomicrobiales bacterium]
MTTKRERDEVNPVDGDQGANQPPDAVTAPGEGEPHDAVGAYLLDALPAEERIAFETHLRTCESCRLEVAQLAPVVQLLPRVLEAESAGAAEEAPGSTLRDRILAAARAEQRPGQSPDADEGGAGEAPDREAVEGKAAPVERMRTAPRGEMVQSEARERDEPPVLPLARPRGRIRGGVTPSPGPAFPLPRNVVRWPRSWLAAAVLAVAFVGAMIWGLSLQGRLDDKNREIATLRMENQTIRARANATAWRIVPTADGPSNAEGTLFFSLPDQRGVVYVVHLPPPPGNRVYQLWYLENAPSAAPVPGATFTVDAQGQGFAPVDPKAPTFDAIALTEEPEGGSTQPTSAVLMIGQLAGAAGQRADPDTATWAFAHLEQIHAGGARVVTAWLIVRPCVLPFGACVCPRHWARAELRSRAVANGMP